jgi:hypothetical protein
MSYIRVYHNQNLQGYFIDSNDLPVASTLWSQLYAVNFTGLASQALTNNAINTIDGKQVLISHSDNAAPTLGASGLFLQGGTNGTPYNTHPIAAWNLTQFPEYDPGLEQMIIARCTGTIGASEGAVGVGFIGLNTVNAISNSGFVMCGLTRPSNVKQWMVTTISSNNIWSNTNYTDPPILDSSANGSTDLYTFSLTKRNALSDYRYQSWTGSLPDPNNNTLLRNRSYTSDMNGGVGGATSQGAMLLSHGGGLAGATTVFWTHMSIWQRH